MDEVYLPRRRAYGFFSYAAVELPGRVDIGCIFPILIFAWDPTFLD